MDEEFFENKIKTWLVKKKKFTALGTENENKPELKDQKSNSVKNKIKPLVL